MKLRELFKLALLGISRSKRRTMLSVLAISIGVFSLVLLTSLSYTLKLEVISNLKGFGGDVIVIVPAKISNIALESRTAGLRATQGRFFESDVKKIKSIEGVKLASPGLFGRVSAVFEDKKVGITVYAVDTSTYRIFSKDVKIKEGRWLSSKYEVVLGSNVEESFEGIDVGKTLVISNISFKVVGILEETGNSITQVDDVLLIPYEAGRDVFSNVFSEQEVSMIMVLVSDGYSTKEVANKIEDFLRKIKKLKEGEEFFSLITRDSIEESISQIIGVINLFFFTLSAIAMIVGLIGIGNSVYMNVLERTREIGVLRAIGMKKRDVLMLFLVEATLFSFFGFFVGIFGVIFLSFILSFFGINIYFDLIFVVIAFFSSFLGTILSSYLPARKASLIPPSQALVYE